MTDGSNVAVAAPRYEPVLDWPKVPHGVSFDGDATSVAVDSQDRVYVFNRGPTPMVVFDAEGNYLDRWGDGEFDSPHSIALDNEDNLYLVDSIGHFVERRSLEGERLLTIGKRGESAEAQSGQYFNRPTDVAIHRATGDLFITDGYRNSHVHRFSDSGKHMATWGGSGYDPGKFSLPHGIAFIDEEHVIVCDRENFRLQTFTLDGEHVSDWGIHHPAAVRFGGATGLIYVAELGPVSYQSGVPHLGNRVSMLRPNGTLVGRFGAPTPGLAPGEFYAPHGLAIDSRGDVYVAEVTRTRMIGLGNEAPRGEVVSLRKWALQNNEGEVGAREQEH